MTSVASMMTHAALVCAVLLTLSNLFITFAWYGHLRGAVYLVFRR
jgi:uncharacterized protein (DUF486 family)